MAEFNDSHDGLTYRGQVVRWYSRRKFGFVRATCNGQELFLGQHDWIHDDEPLIGQIVQFVLGKNQKGWAAVRCAKVETAEMTSSNIVPTRDENIEELREVVASLTTSDEFCALENAMQLYTILHQRNESNIRLDSLTDLSPIYRDEIRFFNEELAGNMFGVELSSESTKEESVMWRSVMNSTEKWSLPSLLFSLVPSEKWENSSLVTQFSHLVSEKAPSTGFHCAIAAWLLCNLRQSDALCLRSIKSGLLVVNWYLTTFANFPFPVALTLEKGAESLLLDSGVSSVANWIVSALSRQWLELEGRVRRRQLEQSLANLSVATIDRDPSPPQAKAKHGELTEEEQHAIVRAHRRNQQADCCFICMDEAVRPTISLLCCGQPCHIKCMERWYASKPNQQGHEKCPQCTQVIPEPASRDQEPTEQRRHQHSTPAAINPPPQYVISQTRREAYLMEYGLIPHSLLVPSVPVVTLRTTEVPQSLSRMAPTYSDYDFSRRSHPQAHPPFSSLPLRRPMVYPPQQPAEESPRSTEGNVCGRCSRALRAAECSNFCCSQCCHSLGRRYCHRHARRMPNGAVVEHAEAAGFH